MAMRFAGLTLLGLAMVPSVPAPRLVPFEGIGRCIEQAEHVIVAEVVVEAPKRLGDRYSVGGGASE